MTIAHHPSEETLVAFVNGTLSEGNAMVVATHLAHCTTCCSTLRNAEELAGSLLDQQAGEEIAASTRSAALAKLDGVPVDTTPKVAVQSAAGGTRQEMAPLSLYDNGKWQWVGPGVYRQFIDVPDDTGTRVFILKAAPGTRLPDHRHVGTEWTCVLKGAFRHKHGRFGAGDFDEADGSVEHNPFVEVGEECVCIVALNGHVEMTGWLGRLIQPLVRL